ncbi:MAG: Acriflavin resistance protein [Desulfotomaculum sp. 46_80]|nr:MAG: Acriflavin resistance protein [Desulfotomaculum sp. 46_80]HAU31245.1 multidrug ABC transporter [Desulfotomaculum sp.]
MKITDASINRPMLIAVLITVVLILGGISLTRLSIDLYPEMQFPIGAVITEYPGAGPQEVEKQVTEPLESALASVSNLEQLTSSSSMGISMVIVMFDWGTDMNFATLQMREKVDMIKQYLPDGSNAPMVFKMDPNQLPIMQLALSSVDRARLKQITDDTIKPRLERVGGVAAVYEAGGYEREIHVSIDPAKLNGYGLSLNAVTNALNGENMNVSGGTASEGSKDLLVRITGEFKNLDDIRNVIVGSNKGSVIHLADIGQVTDGQKKVTQFSRLNGEPGISIFVQKQSGANTVKVAGEVKKALKELKEELPDVQFNVVMDQSQYIEQSINHLIKEIIIGGLLSMVVMWLFLRNLRSTLIISTAIPISIIATFVLLYFNNMTLNLVSMGGLALGVGLIVDDAIVVLENIFRHRQQGYSLTEAPKIATDEVSGAVIASTLTTMAVFLPIVFVNGLAAQLFKPMALTVSFSIFASLLVALTLVPLLSSRLLSLEESSIPKYKFLEKLYNISENWFDHLNQAYRRLLSWALNHRRTVIISVTVLLLASALTFTLVGFEFMPAMDQNTVNVTIQMPKGTSLEKTNQMAARIEKIGSGLPGLESIFTGVGLTGVQGMWGTSSTDQAQVTFKLVDRSRRSLSDQETAEKMRQLAQNIPGADIKVEAQDPSSMGSNFSGGAPIQMKIKGYDLNVLIRKGNELTSLIETIPGTRQVVSSFEEGRPEIQVLVNRDRAAAYGLSPAVIASTVRTAIDGSVASAYRTGGKEIDIRVQLARNESFKLSDLADLTISTPYGSQVTLNEVADLIPSTGPFTIEREDQIRQVLVSAEINDRSLNAVVKDIKNKLPQLKLPDGYTVEFGGEQEMMTDTFKDLSFALILAIILVYLVMVAQFESALFPFIVMFSVPVTIIGISLSLLVTGRAFSVAAFIGVIMLVGIVVKNAIVLIDYVNKLRQRGLSREDALLTAGPIRLRPILMTALTAILAMLPMTFTIGSGSEGQAPMATVVVGGLAFSTLITLVLVPVIYSYLDDLNERWHSRSSKHSLTESKS